MEYEKIKTPSESKQSDFQKILDDLRKEVAIANQLTEKVRYFSNILKQIEPASVPKKDSEIIKEPLDIIENLWEQVLALRRSNEEMEVVANHLQSTIGN